MFGIRIKRSFLTEVILSSVAVGTRAFFQDVPQIRMQNILVESIEAFCATQLTTSPTQRTVIASANVPCVSVSFAVGMQNTIELDNIPLYDLIPGNNSGLMRLYNDKRINLTKSYVTILNAGSLAANQSVLFNIIYFENSIK